MNTIFRRRKKQNRTYDYLLSIDSKSLCPAPCRRLKINCKKHNYHQAMMLCVRNRMSTMWKSRGGTANKFGSFTRNCIKYLGCSLDEYREYLTPRLEIGMTLQNHGKRTWNIDHIKAVDLYTFQHEDDYYRTMLVLIIKTPSHWQHEPTHKKVI
jgi:hypothetical protein